MPTAYEPPRTLAAMLHRFIARHTAQDPLRIPAEFRCVSFTFDDFPKSAATTGRTMLEQFGWRGTWFASGCFCSGTTHYGPMYDKADLASLAAAGHEIGNHTFSHLDCAQFPRAHVAADTERNQQFLTTSAGIPEPVSFAFPYGEATFQVKKTLGKQFAGLRGVSRGVNRAVADRCMLRSVPVVAHAKPASATDYAQDIASRGGWLIYAFHDIQPEPTKWGCRPGDMKSVLQAVRQSGAEVKPLGEVLRLLLGRQHNP